MKRPYTIPLTIVAVFLLAVFGFAQRGGSLADNAALRYWSAFSQVQDATISDQEANELNAILHGTAPYDDSKYKDLLDKNAPALEIMIRGTSLSKCEWGLDYGLGEHLPVDYARKALVLGRLNVLYASHLFVAGDKEAAVRALAAGLRFSHDVGNGGSLFATLIAKDLLMNHLKAIMDALHGEHLSSTQQSRLREAVARLGSGLDWQFAARLDLEALRDHYSLDSQASAALSRIITSYLAAISDESKLPMLDVAIHSAPKQLADLIPNAKRVLEERRDLRDRLLQTRSILH